MNVSLRNLLLAACWWLPACTVVGPDYEPPAAPALPTEWSAEQRDEGLQAVTEWWGLFDDPVLNELIQRGGRQNLSLEAAGLRIAQARAALGISEGLTFPQLQQISANLSGLYQDENSFYNAGVGLDVGWEMDIWGKYARGIETAEANLYASVASYRDVLVSLSAEIARNYINYRTAQERAYLSQQNIAIQERVVGMTQVQFEAGNVSELDVQQARTQLYATQASLPGLTTARLQARNALAVLLGTLPEEIDPLLAVSARRETIAPELRFQESALEQGLGEDFLQRYAALSVIPAAPEATPEIDPQLILQRPDLQVAELSARAQNARIGAAQAQLYPSFSLFGSIGLTDTVRAGERFSASNAVVAAAGPGLSWNVFQYDRLRNQVRIEDARFQESLTNYNLQVLQAVREVSDALLAYQYSLQRLDYDFLAVEASIRAFNISANQYNNGLVTYQRLLSTVEKMTLREDVYAQTRGNIAIQLVALYKALGGGWQGHGALPLIRQDTIDKMKARTDWGELLEPDTLSGADRDD